MDPRLKRKRDLEETIAKDYSLLKELEDARRYEDEPLRRVKLQGQIEDLNNQLTARQTELETISRQLRGTGLDMVDFGKPAESPAALWPASIPDERYYALSPETPLPESSFVGRGQLIEALLSAAKTTRMIAILGIPAIGKTALMKQIASHFDRNLVLWYEFWPDLLSLDDVLIKLARFLDSQPGREGHLAGALWAPSTTQLDRIQLIVNELNEGGYYLFFDSVHHIEGHSALDSFFSILKRELRKGTVFVAGRSRPVFCTSVDEAMHLAKCTELQGLSISEVREFFAQYGITVRDQAAETLDEQFGGLPLALRFLVALLGEDSTEAELLALADKAEWQATEYLFDEVYDRLGEAERTLLTTASIFNLPFSQARLLGAHRAIFEKADGMTALAKLKRQFLIQQFTSDVYQIHEIIRTLLLQQADNPDGQRIQLADYLVSQMPDDLSVHLEATLLYFQASAFDQAAQLAVPMIDLSLLPYSPDLAQTMLSAFEEQMVKPEQWMWLVGSQGNLAHFWRRYAEAEDRYRTMLRIAGELQDKDAAAVAFQRLGNVYLRNDDQKAERYYSHGLALKKELNDVEGQASIYNNLGLLHTGRGEFGDALSVLEKGLRLLDESGASEWRKLSLYSNLGSLYGEEEQWRQAIEYQERARQIAEQEGSPYDLAKLTYNLGVSEKRPGHHETARKRFLEALEIAEAYGFWEIEEWTLVALGKQNHELGEYDKAIGCFRRVAEIQEDIGDKPKLAATSFDIGTFYWHKGDYEAAHGYYEKGISLFEHLTDEEQVRVFLTNIYGLAADSAEPRQILQPLKRLKNRLLAQGAPSYALARTYGTLGQIYLTVLNRTRVALACMREEINLLAQLNRRQEQVEALTDFGVVCEDLGRYGDALDSYTEAVGLAEESGLARPLAVALYNRANSFAVLEIWHKAEDDYQQAEKTAEEIGDAQLQDATHHNLGETYRRQGRLEDAVELLLLSLASARQRADIDDEMRTLNNLGLAYQALSQKQEALRCFHGALDLGRHHYRKRDEANVLISIGNFYLEDGLPDRAKEYYEEALAAARVAEDTELEEGSILSLAYAHRELGTFDDIAEDFQAIGERASRLKHQDNVVDFLIFAGETNLAEREPAAAADMFEKALLVALELAGRRIEAYESRAPNVPTFPALFKVISRICVCVDEALRGDNVDHAQAFHDDLLTRLRTAESWGQFGLWMTDLLRPIGDYLDERPEQPIWEFVAGAWDQPESWGPDA